MVWFRVDDVFADHPKVIMAGNAAIGLWVRAGTWSMRHLTDGFIPEAVVPMLGTVEEAQALVRVELWDAVEGGFRFHAWEGRQPTREEVEERRRVRSEAGRKGGVNSGASRREAKRGANAEANASAKSKRKGSHTDEANANPVPSRPVDDYYLVLKESLESNARDLKPEEIAGIRDALTAPFGRTPTELEAATVWSMLLETADGAVKWPVNYVLRCIDRSPAKVRGICAEAARQSAVVLNELGGVA